MKIPVYKVELQFRSDVAGACPVSQTLLNDFIESVVSGTETFRLATLPLSNSRLSVLAFLATGHGTTGDVAESCGIDRVQAYRIVKAHGGAGWLEFIGRNRWRITLQGITELERIHYEIGSIIAARQSHNEAEHSRNESL